MRLWNFWVKDSCPFCLEDNETTQHILHCDHTDAKQIWYQAVAKFRRKLETYRTDPTLLEALCNDLDAWRHNEPFPNSIYLPISLQEVVESLREISYDQVLEGLLPKSLIR